MLYGIGRADASGRIAHRDIVSALRWQPGDKLQVLMTSGAIVISASPDGFFSVPRRPCIAIPVTARRNLHIRAGDHVLLAAAPAYGIVIVHSQAALDEMIARYHSAHPPIKRHEDE